MSKKDSAPFRISPEEMRGWLKREIADIAKAMELRVAEATGFVEAYARGDLSQDEMEKRAYEYSCRWGEPLPGVGRSEGLTNEQILERINKTRAWQSELEPKAIRNRNAISRTPRR